MYNFESPLFPAIAIPVQTKSDDYFECPDTHRSHLWEMLQHITKILIIGWQAKEEHFLRMLRSRLPRLSHLMVVGANATDAERTLKYFQTEIRLIIANQYVGQGGFSSFIMSQEGHNFFSS